MPNERPEGSNDAMPTPDDTPGPGRSHGPVAARSRKGRKRFVALFMALAHLVGALTSLQAVMETRTAQKHAGLDGGAMSLAALDRLQEFFAQISPVAEGEPLSQLRIAQMHAMDHLTRLQTRLTPPASVRRVLADPRLQAAVTLTRAILEQGEAGLRGGVTDDWLTRVQQQASELVELRRQERPLILQQTAGGASAPAQALEVLDAMRWLDRVGYHAWRICNYLGGDGKPEPVLKDANPEE
jgi:hypothetical protein